mgnify:FL=1
MLLLSTSILSKDSIRNSFTVQHERPEPTLAARLQQERQRLNLSEADTGRRIRAVYDQFFQPGPCLSPRELELLGLLNKGYTFKKCAELMGVSESTTKTQAARAADAD